MTLDRTAARARCEAATERPWEWNDSSDVRGHKGELKAPSPTNGFMLVSAFVNSADGPFIAHARTDLPLALDALDAKDAEIERLTRQVENFRDGLQGARDLYREKSGKPDRFSDEGDWWQNPDDQCVVLWLIEWAEDIQSDLIKQLGADKTRMEGALKRLRDFGTDKTVSGAWLYGFCDAALEGEGVMPSFDYTPEGRYESLMYYGQWTDDDTVSALVSKDEDIAALRSRIATLEAQVEQARGLLKDRKVRFEWLEAYQPRAVNRARIDEINQALQALREGGKG